MIFNTILNLNSWIKVKREKNRKSCLKEINLLSISSVISTPIALCFAFFTNIKEHLFNAFALTVFSIVALVSIFASIFGYLVDYPQVKKTSPIITAIDLKNETIKEMLNFIIAMSLVKNNPKAYSFNMLCEIEEAFAYNQSMLNKMSINDYPQSIQKQINENTEIITSVLNICIEQYIHLNLSNSIEFQNLLENVNFKEKVNQLKCQKDELNEESLLNECIVKQKNEQKHNKLLAL